MCITLHNAVSHNWDHRCQSAVTVCATLVKTEFVRDTSYIHTLPWKICLFCLALTITMKQFYMWRMTPSLAAALEMDHHQSWAEVWFGCNWYSKRHTLKWVVYVFNLVLWLRLCGTNAIDLLLINPGPKCKRTNTNLWSKCWSKIFTPYTQKQALP